MREPGHRKVEKVMRRLARAITGMELPAVEKISEAHANDPFQILIATLLSARTQDATTDAAATRLFARARTPKAMAKLTVREIEALIYPVSFYRNKARFVKATCEALEERFGGKVPASLDELVTLPGVGRKTANLVMILGFQSRQNICVDTHVQRNANRVGWVRTRDPIRPRPSNAGCSSGADSFARTCPLPRLTFRRCRRSIALRRPASDSANTPRAPAVPRVIATSMASASA